MVPQPVTQGSPVSISLLVVSETEKENEIIKALITVFSLSDITCLSIFTAKDKDE